MTFAFVSDHIALDFTGTVQHRRTDALDLLATPDDVARWMKEAGLIDIPAPVTADEFAQVIRLREAIYRLACAAMDCVGYNALDRSLLNRAAANTPARLHLTADGSVTRAGGVGAVLATVSRSTIELLGSGSPHAIKECAAEECTRLYVDRSRHSSRRWCDMRQCGNRVKAAVFRAHHQT